MPKLDRVFAYIVEDTGPEDESVPFVRTPLGWMPLMGGGAGLDLMVHAAGMEGAAQGVADSSGKPVELRVFTQMTTVKVIYPRQAAKA